MEADCVENEPWTPVSAIWSSFDGINKTQNEKQSKYYLFKTVTMQLCDKITIRFFERPHQQLLITPVKAIRNSILLNNLFFMKHLA